MSKLRVHSFSISIDGFGAGPNQDLENPLGVGGLKVFDWFFPTRTWQRMHGNEDGETGVDDDAAARGFEGIGAYILGRNMFGRSEARARGRMSGKAGGEMSRRITRRSLCSRITRGLRSRWRAAPHFISSLTAFTQPSSRLRMRRAGRMCVWEAASLRFGNI